MADLGELLGTLVVGLAHARRMADEESAAIAEHYRDHPLLERMSVPRIRVQELVVDVPVLLETFAEGVPSTPGDATLVRKALSEELRVGLGIRVSVELTEPGGLPRWDHKAKRVRDERSEVPF